MQLIWSKFTELGLSLFAFLSKATSAQPNGFWSTLLLRTEEDCNNETMSRFLAKDKSVYWEQEWKTTAYLLWHSVRGNPLSYPSSWCCFALPTQQNSDHICVLTGLCLIYYLIIFEMSQEVGRRVIGSQTGKEIPGKAIVAKIGAGKPEARLHTQGKVLSIKMWKAATVSNMER